MSGQFSVKYDVDHVSEGGEIQVVDGYFVHFFAPNNLLHLNKHVYFVLDVSGSMSGALCSGYQDFALTLLCGRSQNLEITLHCSGLCALCKLTDTLMMIPFIRHAGRKIEQMREAMLLILDDLKEGDIFTLMKFR